VSDHDPYYTARKTPGAGLKDYEGQIDMARLRRYRMARPREQLKRLDVAGCLLYDPVNIRYASGTRTGMKISHAARR